MLLVLHKFIRLIQLLRLGHDGPVNLEEALLEVVVDVLGLTLVPTNNALWRLGEVDEIVAAEVLRNLIRRNVVVDLVVRQQNDL